MPLTIGSLIAVHREKGRFNLGQVTNIEPNTISYLRIRDTPHDHWKHFIDPSAKESYHHLRPALPTVKLLIGTPMLVMTNGFWRLASLFDYHKDVNMYEVRFNNGRTSWVAPRNAYHVIGK